MGSQRKEQLYAEQRAIKDKILQDFDTVYAKMFKRVAENPNNTTESIQRYKEGIADDRRVYADFLEYPEKFHVTSGAALTVCMREYLHEEELNRAIDAVVGARGQEQREAAISQRLKLAEGKLENGELRNVFVTVSFGYSEVFGGETQILNTHAEVRQKDGDYKEKTYNSVRFHITNYIERISEPS